MSTTNQPINNQQTTMTSLKHTLITSAAVMAGGIMTTQAAAISQWTFADQGFGGSAATALQGTAGAGATASALGIGSGYANATSVEHATTDGVYSSYIDATGRISTLNAGYVSATGLDAVSHARFDTNAEYWGVGDWNDGTAGGGRIQISTLEPFPSTSGPADTGALYLNSSSSLRDGVGEAVTNNLFVTVAVTASGAELTLEDFSFYASRTNNNPNRSWADWTLEVDTGLGFSLLSTVTTGTADNSWNLESLDFADIVLADGETATFRLAGKSTVNSAFGRGIAIDDISINGTSAVPEPSSAALLGLGGLALILRRRK